MNTAQAPSTTAWITMTCVGTDSSSEIMNIATIDKTLTIFVDRLIAPSRRQLSISGPKTLCSRSHRCSLFDDFANAKAATRTNGVVGSNGSRTPAPPSASEKKPIVSQARRENTGLLTSVPIPAPRTSGRLA